MRKLRKILAAALLLTCITISPLQASEYGKKMLAADANQPIISFKQHHTLLVDALEGGPSLDVFQDGKAVIFIPASMKGAGSYALDLGQEGVAQLLRDIEEADLIDFDKGMALEQRAVALQARVAASGEQRIIMDSTLTQISLNFRLVDQVKNESRLVQKDIEWRDLQIDALHFPNFDTLIKLGSFEKNLLAMTRDSKRIAVEQNCKEAGSCD